MRMQKNVMVFEVGDLNAVLAQQLRVFQFRYANRFPDKIIIEQPSSATGRNRSRDADYDVPVEYVYGDDYMCQKCAGKVHKLGSKIHQEHQNHIIALDDRTS